MYILGDLFEYWVGNDDPQSVGSEVANGLAALARSGVPVYFLRGNRAFLLGGLRRADRPRRVPLAHGDVVVWGGPARLRYHGVLPLEAGHHPVMGGHRINLTFRRAA